MCKIMENMIDRQSGRDLKWDLIKAFAIFLVILGHCIQIMDPLWQQNLVQRIIYSFHMPLFMFISGYFAMSSKNTGSGKWIIDKLRRLLVPCVVHGIVLSAALYFLAKTPQPCPNIISVLNVTWYLFVLFLLLVFARIFDSIPWKAVRIIAWCVLYVVVFFVDFEPDSLYIVGMTPFFLVGRWWRNKEKMYPSTIVLVLLSLIFLAICSQWTFENSVYDMHLGQLSGLVVRQLAIFYSCGFCGISLVLLVFKYCPAEGRIAPLIAKVGQRTLDLYVLQIYAIMLLNRIGIATDKIVYCMLAAIVITSFCFVVSSLIRKNRFLSQLILGARIK